MEENKKVCCEGKENCNCEQMIHKCYCGWKKCHMMRKIIWIAVAILIFSLGAQWGEMKSESRSYRYEKGFNMMNKNSDKFEGRMNNFKNTTDEVTVEVKTPTPEVSPKQ